ncbi:hypothetical protein BDQ17DRAFT_1432833 [Cyathus striatus]|nr:hypothetical protein BDQ17DRAFT_1432833 [Cyathus striatus]
MSAAADVLGPPLWGLRVHYGRGKGRRMSDNEERLVREEVRNAIDGLFQTHSSHTSKNQIPNSAHTYYPSLPPASTPPPNTAY